MRRTWYRFGILAIVAGLVATACGGGDSNDNSAQTSETTAASTARQEITVGLDIDAYIVSGSRANLGAGLSIYDTLVQIDPQYNVKPMLAERWEFRAPGTWRFFLRRGVTFHDGQPFNAQAVKTGLFDRLAANPPGGTIRAGTSSAVVVDDNTIDFTPTGDPNLRVIEQIGHPSNFVAAPGSDPGTKPVGTGPFKFVSYAAKERLVVERNATYWGGPPKLEKITYRYISDANTRRLALESGEVDAILNVPTPDVKGLKDKKLQVVTSAVGAYDALYLNRTDVSLLADPVLRMAVAQSIDRRAIANGVLDGVATPDPTMVPPSALGSYSSTVKGVPFDPAKAKTALDAAGWKAGSDGVRTKDGKRLKLQLVSGLPNAETLRPIPAFIQSQLKDVGIELEIVERPDSASYQSLIAENKGDIFIEQGNQNDANPAFLPILLFYTGGTGASAPYVKLFGPGATFDKLIAPALSEVDSDKVRKATADAMHNIIDEEAIVVPLAGVPRVWAMKASVRGFTAHPSVINQRWESVSVT